MDIVKLLKKHGYRTIQELAEELGVSGSTIRRDIGELAARKLVAGTKSGVVPISDNVSDAPLNYRSKVNSRAKAAIAWEAISLVKEGDTVFLDSSSTVLQLAPALNSLRRITVVTNSLLTARNFRDAQVPVFLIGGEISPLSYGFYGPVAERALRQFNFDIAFFSPVGVTPQNCAAETVEPAAAVRRAAIRQAQHAALLFDHTKIGVVRPFNFARLDEFDHLVTDDAKHDFDTTAAVHRVRL
ncbi:MAG: DeoR/GlpR transcriptional regulator [Ruminococcaceae bacterium]|nr:DeoR/GlpR transcriptional regulator [Oscillospiraceae bacterium]